MGKYNTVFTLQNLTASVMINNGVPLQLELVSKVSQYIKISCNQNYPCKIL